MGFVMPRFSLKGGQTSSIGASTFSLGVATVTLDVGLSRSSTSYSVNRTVCEAANVHHIFRGLMTAMVALSFGAGLMMISSEPLRADAKIEKNRIADFLISIEISNTITKKDADEC